MTEPRCALCDSDNIYLGEIGISIGMGGFDYSFCKDCLTSLSADEFWRKFITKLGYKYPLVPLDRSADSNE